MEDKPNYHMWLLAIWFSLFLGQCSQQKYNQDVIKELHEIKMEIKNK